MPDTVNQKISELPSASSPGNNDVLAGVQSNTTKKFTLSALKTFFQNGLVPTSRKVNNKALSADITLDKSDIGLGNVDNVQQYSASNKPSAADVTYDGSIGGVIPAGGGTVKGALDYLSVGSSDLPEMDSSTGGAAGSSYKWSRSDHQHPSDTSRVPTARTINNMALNADLVLYWGGTITLSLSWSGNGPFTQTVYLDQYLSWTSGITAKSRIDLQPTAAQLTQLMTDGVTALTIENNNGTLTAYALGAAPSTAMTIACTVTEVET